MPPKTIALTLLACLLLATVTVPAASADHVVCNRERLPEPVCNVLESHGVEIVLCLYNTPPRDWLQDCV